MKKEAIKRLVKDVLIVLITYLITYGILSISGTEGDLALRAVVPYLIAALPMGWRWSSKVIHAVSIQGVLLKAVFSIFLGFIAVPVVIISDIIRVLVTKDEVVKVQIEE